MRTIFIKQATDWTALAAQLVPDAADRARTLATLQRLNPNLDFAALPSGAVLLVPDQPGLKADASDSIGGDAFAALQAQLNDAVAATAADTRRGRTERLAAQKDLGAVLKSAVVRRLVDNDPDLARQAAAAFDAAKNDAVQAKAADAAMQTLQKTASEELVALARLMRSA